MPDVRSRVWPGRVAILAFVVVAAVVGAALFATRDWESEAVDSAFARVTSIGQLKSAQLSSWLDDRRRMVRTTAIWLSYTTTFRTVVSERTDEKAEAFLRTLVEFARREAIAASASLTDTSGRILIGTDSQESTLDPTALEVVHIVAASGTTTHSRFYRCAHCDRIHLDIAAPVRGQDGAIAAVLVVSLNPDQYVYPMLRSWPTSTATGESFLIRRTAGNRVEFLSPTMQGGDRSVLTESSRPWQTSFTTTMDGRGAFDGVGYQGARVIADRQHVDGTDWFVISHVTRDEAVSDTRARKLEVAAFALLAIVLVGMTLWRINLKNLRDQYRSLYQLELQRREAEAAQHEAEKRYGVLVETATEAIIVQFGGTITYANPSALRLAGVDSIEQMVGTKAVDWVRPAFRSRVEERLRTTNVDGLPIPLIELEFVRLDGTTITVESTAAPLREQDRKGSVVFMRDVTERRRLEASLLHAQRMEAIGRLAGGIAHDFNNVLTVIIGYAESCLAEPPPPSLRHDIAQIQQAGRRAARLTSQLLAFSRRQVMRPITVNPNDVIRGCRPMLAKVIGEDIEIRTALLPELPNVTADPGQLEQILMNLVVNARDAMPDGGEIVIATGTAVLDANFVETHPGARQGRHVQISLSDNGVGMNRETQQRVFEPFFTTKPAGRGTGLGLSTVYGIVKQSGGSVYVQSAPGAGATFTVYLPATDAPAEVLTEEHLPGITTGTERILLVEDDTLVRQLVLKLLSEAGYTVETAASAAEAIELVANAEAVFDLLITDVVMPVTNGRELAARLTRARPDLRVLYMSGYAESSVIGPGDLRRGMHFLSKPFTVETLRRKVRELLDIPTPEILERGNSQLGGFGEVPGDQDSERG
jgi:two-component system, cell cycle sensor histidine kinase and response regulator CckA